MKNKLKRFLSSILAFAIIASTFVGLHVNAATFDYKNFVDEDASLDSKFPKVENYDADYGNVYKFETGTTYEGTDWFSEGFENGTYVVSMDFKVDQYPVSGTAISIMTDSEEWTDRVTLALRATGVLAYTMRDAEGIRQSYDYKYGTNYTAGEWNNYSIVYEKKSDTEVVATQYVNGVKVQEGVTLSDNFRFRRITVVTSAERGLYLDNISCKKIEGEDAFSIENVNPVLAASSKTSVEKLRVKLNQVASPSSVTSVSVKKTGTNAEITTSYKVVGEYIDVFVNNLASNEGYTLSINEDAKSIVGNTITGNTFEKQQEGTVVPYLHRDEDALLDSNYPKVENYDEEHGNVYKFSEQKEVQGTDWFTEGFENGTYVVSMDFKVNQYPASGTFISIMTDSEEWTDRVTLALRATGVLAYTIRDAEAERTGYQYKYGTNYAENAWNNYSIVYEKKSETEVIATQYVNGVKVQDGVTLSDNFRFRRITILPQTAEGTELYLDNITCRKVSDEELKIESVTPVLKTDSDSVRELVVKLNQVIAPESVTGVSVVKAGSELNLAGIYRVVGQYIYVNVSSLSDADGYTLAVNSDALSITGNQATELQFQKESEAKGISYLHKDEDALLDKNYTKVENYDKEHGDVYKFDKKAEIKGSDWFTEGFENGTYVVSMDFKVNKYPASGTTMSIYTESEAWNDRVTLALRATGVIAYTIRDAEAERTGYQYKYGTNYAENAWNNYSIVYEKKSDAEVIATQYINGVKMQEGVTLTDNFRFRRITLHHATSEDFEFYLDNITCRKVSDEKFTIEEINTIENGNAVENIVVKLNQPVVSKTVTSVTVTKDGETQNIATGFRAVGQYIYADVSGLDKTDGYTLELNNGILSINSAGLSKTTVTVPADNKAVLAYWVSGGSEQNIESVVLADGAQLNSEDFEGKASQSITKDISFILSDVFKPESFDGSEYEFEIVYYDGAKTEKNEDGNPNFFQLIYDSLAGNDVDYNNIVYKEGTSQWKTAKIKVSDINLAKGVSGGYDFKLSATGILPPSYNTDKASANPVRIHSVKVTKDEAKNPLVVTTATEQSGNAFAYYDNNKVITNTYQNVSAETKILTVITKLVDSKGVESFKNEETLNIAAGETKVSDIELDNFEKCGVFDVIVEVKSGEETVTTTKTTKIAVLKKDPNGIKDENIFLSVHSERYDVEGQETAADILDLMNVAGSRVGIGWNDMLVKRDGEYVLDWNSHPNKNFVSMLKERDMVAYGLMAGAPSKEKVPASPGYMNMPITDEEVAAFSEYAEYVGENVVKDGFKYLEIYNEPNLKSFVYNLEAASGTEYAKTAIAAKAAIESGAEKAGVTGFEIAGPGVTGINQNESYTNENLASGSRGGYHYIQQAVNAGLAESFDNVSFHLYTWDDAENATKRLSDIRKIRALWTGKGQETPDLWVTEAGFYEGASYADTAAKQGAQNVRQILTHKANGIFGSLYSIYALEDKGYNPELRESNWGIINPIYANLREDGGVGIPKEGAVMLSAMTYVMPNAEFVSKKTIYTNLFEAITLQTYTSDKWDGKQIKVAYNTDNNVASVTLDLGAKKVKMFDEFGNETMLTSTDGNYMVTVSDAPIYFVADFDGNDDITLSMVKNDISYSAEEVIFENIDFSDLTFEIDNAGILPESAKLLMSVYEDNRFVGAKYVNCADFEVSDGRMIIESSIENMGEFDEVKFMLLGDFTTMKPLAKSFNCK